MNGSNNVAVTVSTGPNAGAVAIVDLTGPGVVELLQRLTGRPVWNPCLVQRVALPDIDLVTAVVLTPCHAQVMPHGGTRVVQRTIKRLVSLGATYDPAPPHRDRFSEGNCAIESDMLAAIADAASPAAIDWLLAQPRFWRAWAATAQDTRESRRAILRRSAVLDHLLEPATVIVVGRPNVGKSTLRNQMAGRDASVVSDEPGTTRDWVGGPVTLHGTPAGAVTPPEHAVVVDWIDTPGLRDAGAEEEHAARRLAASTIALADVLIAMRDDVAPWPDASEMTRTVDIWVVNKCDVTPPALLGDGRTAATPLGVSAVEGTGIAGLQAAVLSRLALRPWPEASCWAFSDRLRSELTDVSHPDLTDYLSRH